MIIPSLPVLYIYRQLYIYIYIYIYVCVKVICQQSSTCCRCTWAYVGVHVVGVDEHTDFGVQQFEQHVHSRPVDQVQKEGHGERTDDSRQVCSTSNMASCNILVLMP